MRYFISLPEAIAMTTRYRAERENVLKTAYQNQAILPLSESFARSAFDALLAKEGCSGLRIYYGMDESLKLHAIVVGVDAEGHDILPILENREDSDPVPEDFIIEHGVRCPDICPAVSPLNA